MATCRRSGTPTPPRPSHTVHRTGLFNAVLGQIVPPLAEEPAVLKGHNNSVSSVAFSPDGRTLASASDNRTSAIEPLTLVLADLACNRPLRNLDREEWSQLIGAGNPYQRVCLNLP